MKAKMIIFLILFTIFEGLAFLIAYAIQTLYVIKMDGLDISFISLFLSYLFHPIYAIQECMQYKNPFIVIAPVGAIILVIYILFSTRDTYKSGIDSKADIYGTANWDTIGNLTRKNIMGKSKFITCSKKMFLNEFMESINEKK